MTKSFTLVETLIAIFIFFVIMVGLSSSLVWLYRTHSYAWQQALAVDEARRGIETMVKEIREAKQADNGAYPIELANDKEFIFYSDIDHDGKTERVRYFLGQTNSQTVSQECQTFLRGGSCSVDFSNFLQGIPVSAQVQVSLQGDFGWNNREYADIYADGQLLGRVCRTGCSDCPGSWEGTTVFDISTTTIADNDVSFLADASSRVDPFCPYAMEANFEFSFTENLQDQAHQFKKGVIEPVGDPPAYPTENEKITVLTSYVRNAPPIFEYFDQNGDRITGYPARLSDTKLMKVYLIVNVDPNRPPNEFEIESYVQLRNLKEE